MVRAVVSQPVESSLTYMKYSVAQIMVNASKKAIEIPAKFR